MRRIERARRRVTFTRYVLGVASVAALAGFAAVARSANPGTHSATSTRTSVTRASSYDGALFSADGGSGSNIGPAGSAQPQIQSGAS